MTIVVRIANAFNALVVSMLPLPLELFQGST